MSWIKKQAKVDYILSITKEKRSLVSYIHTTLLTDGQPK